MNNYGLTLTNSIFDQDTTELFLARRMTAAITARLERGSELTWKSEVQGIADMLRIDFMTAWEALDTAAGI